MNNVDKILLPRREAAAKLSLSLRSIDLLIASGELPSVRVGRRVLIHQTALDQFATRSHTGRIRPAK